MMNAEECNQRACHCAANAATATDEAISLEFLRMAGQWRAMAVSQNFVGYPADPVASQNPPVARTAVQAETQR